MNLKLQKTFAISLLSFSFVSAAYIFLLSQTSQARLGNFLTPVYLLQYFILFFGISYVQPKIVIAPIFGIINGLGLFSFQIYRHGGWLSWDFLIELPIVFLAILNFIISIIFIVVFYIKNRRANRCSTK
jgi:hypothetical protein